MVSDPSPVKSLPGVAGGADRPSEQVPVPSTCRPTTSSTVWFADELDAELSTNLVTRCGTSDELSGSSPPRVLLHGPP